MRQKLKVIALAGLFASAGVGMSGRGASASLTVPFELVGPQVATIPTSPPVAASAANRFVYGPGFAGLGYYQLASPGSISPPRSAPTVSGFPGPGRASTGRTGGRVRDWTTGHSLPSGGLMSKPWLRPR
jgi:hypothetical protein